MGIVAQPTRENRTIIVDFRSETTIREAVRGGAFDYMGDKRADLPLFRAARLALLVRPSKRLLTRARASCRVGHVFD
jgi:hypothetical protein